ncbi:conjugative transposon protein TraJ [Lacibacter sp.]|uniref:conjugative transposon protein TraJ n=1 Tax=Lacibacter sp. TaxID=1915409 RepID=UPI002B4B3A3E|nr:conjugative transposon protein TraJ [Lacibacter sp.]HLP37768.1 conjugative transposon protein TraJ [Lacibacter sp.]
MNLCVRSMMILSALFLPFLSSAQSSVAGSIRSLQSVLEQLYNEMIPLCSQLIGVGRGIAGFAATWYIASRVWGHIARSEPVDFYPLFRPFVLGFAILIFPSVIAMINGVMKPTVTATAAMVKNSDKAIAQLLIMKEQAIKQTDYWQMYVGPAGLGDRDRWYKYYYKDQTEDWFESIGNDVKFAAAKFSYQFRNSIKQLMAEVLQILFEAAALCINTIRTFYMIVLAILGPLVFGIAVFDGFQHTLTVWIARYLNIFLWLPVANIFGGIIGKIQENMLKVDLQQINSTGDTFFSSTDTAYLIFLIIGIIGYFTVPSVANYIVNAGGGNTLLNKVTMMMSSSTMAVAATSAAMSKDVLGSVHNKLTNSMSDAGLSNGYFKDNAAGSGNSYQRDKLSGQT